MPFRLSTIAATETQSPHQPLSPSRSSRSFCKLFSLILLMAGTTLAGDITVHLTDAPGEGTAVFLLFDSAAGFDGLDGPIVETAVPLDGRESYSITNVPAGTYVLTVYYDQNGNGRIDRNFIGIPREPVGFSNGYRPKGPPSFSRAAFDLRESDVTRFDIEPVKPLGEFGRIGVGIGVIIRTSVYRDYDNNVYQVIPAVTYTGEKLQIFGPRIQCGIAGSGDIRLAVTAEYRLGAYEEDESPFLTGMGDRDDTLMLGLALQAELPGRVDVSASCSLDALDEIGGGKASLSLNHSFLLGVLRLSPKIGMNWLSSDLANHDFGVPANAAIDGRPAYHLDGAYRLEIGTKVFIEITRDVLVVADISIEYLNSEVTDSPIVDESQLVKGFAALNFVF